MKTYKQIEKALKEQTQKTGSQTKDVISLLQDSTATLEVGERTKKLLLLYAEISEAQERTNEITAEIFGAEGREFEITDRYFKDLKNYLSKKIMRGIFGNVFSSKCHSI